MTLSGVRDVHRAADRCAFHTKRYLADEERSRTERFRRWFGFEPDDLDFKILWGMADAVELQFLREYFADQGWASNRAVKRAIEKLQAAMRPAKEELDRPEPTNAEIARSFLSEACPAENPRRSRGL